MPNLPGMVALKSVIFHPLQIPDFIPVLSSSKAGLVLHC